MLHRNVGEVSTSLVLEKKMFKGKYVIDAPTRDPLGSKTWYEQFLSGTHRRCDV